MFNGPELFSCESVGSVANFVQFSCRPSQSAVTQDFDRGQLAASHPLSGADETFNVSAEAETDFYSVNSVWRFSNLTRKR